MTVVQAPSAIVFALLLPFILGYVKDRWFSIRDMTRDEYEHHVNPTAYHHRHGRR